MGSLFHTLDGDWGGDSRYEPCLQPAALLTPSPAREAATLANEPRPATRVCLMPSGPAARATGGRRWSVTGDRWS